MWWRKIVCKLFGYKLVYIQHHDGEVLLRLVEPTPFGLTGWSTSRFFRIGPFTCLENGTCRGVSFVKFWKSVNG